MSAWYNGYAEPKEMVIQGYRLISIPDGLIYIVPAAGYYNAYLNTKYLYENWTPAHEGKAVFEENYLKNAEMSIEDDYDIIDGIINNGNKQQEYEKLKEPEKNSERRTAPISRNQIK